MTSAMSRHAGGGYREALGLDNVGYQGRNPVYNDSRGYNDGSGDRHQAANGPNFSMSEFPSLSNRLANMHVGSGRDNYGTYYHDNNPQKQQEFRVQKEDFPALGEATPGPKPLSQQGSGDNAETGKSRKNDGSEETSSSASTSPGWRSAADKDSAAGDKYGLLGLLSVIRMTDPNLNTLALGTDLTTLGLNLNSADGLYPTFSSPWSETPATWEPQYSLPLCYYTQPPVLKTSHLSKLQLETLFYIFYAMPKDILQIYSAQELYNRDWHYHCELKLWFKRASQTDNIPAGSGANVQYIYFDINAWERRIFNGNPTVVSRGLMSVDELRAKFSGTGHDLVAEYRAGGSFEEEMTVAPAWPKL